MSKVGQKVQSTKIMDLVAQLESVEATRTRIVLRLETEKRAKVRKEMWLELEHILVLELNLVRAVHDLVADVNWDAWPVDLPVEI